MNRKERMLTAFANQEPDRVPIAYYANGGIDGRLKKHFGLTPDDGEGLRQALGVDFREVHTPYVGPQLHEDIPERGIQVDEWGRQKRYLLLSPKGIHMFSEGTKALVRNVLEFISQSLKGTNVMHVSPFQGRNMGICPYEFQGFQPFAMHVCPLWGRSFGLYSREKGNGVNLCETRCEHARNLA